MTLSRPGDSMNGLQLIPCAHRNPESWTLQQEVNQGLPSDRPTQLSEASTMSTIMTKRHAQTSPPRGMTVDEFEQLEESLGDVRIELIDGRIFRRDDMNPPHVSLSSVNRAKAGIAFFGALANNAASSGEASSAKECGGWTAHGSWSRVDGDLDSG